MKTILNLSKARLKAELLLSFRVQDKTNLNIYHFSALYPSSDNPTKKEPYQNSGLAFAFTKSYNNKMAVLINKEASFYLLFKDMFEKIEKIYNNNESLKKYNHVIDNPNEIRLYNDFVADDNFKINDDLFIRDTPLGIEFKFNGKTSARKGNIIILKDGSKNGEYAYAIITSSLKTLKKIIPYEKELSKRKILH